MRLPRPSTTGSFEKHDYVNGARPARNVASRAKVDRKSRLRNSIELVF
jgi:hypothetical protein